MISTTEATTLRMKLIIVVFLFHPGASHAQVYKE